LGRRRQSTYDLSNYANNITIDLAPGGWSITSPTQCATLEDNKVAKGTVYNAFLFSGDLRSIIEHATGGPGNDSIRGNQANNGLRGNGGNDTLKGLAGNDSLSGSVGNDILLGGVDTDSLSGGGGTDKFDFNFVDESKVGSVRDIINDFVRGTDHIDLRSIDARSGSGNQDFTWIGNSVFYKVKGELHYRDLGASCLVQGDVTGDGKGRLRNPRQSRRTG
jgi:serralysin